jgi:hypothetical protein
MTLAHFLPCYGGSIDPHYKSTASVQRETEICLRSFGQIARRRSGLAPFLKQRRLTRLKRSNSAIKGCDKMNSNGT